MSKHHDIHREILATANQLTKQLNVQVGVLNAKLNTMPPEQREHFAKEQAQINHILNVAKTGDFSKLQKIVDQHANSDNNK